ncbi:hypothetical protein P7K49_012937, partial [Saguinus oedipus]
GCAGAGRGAGAGAGADAALGSPPRPCRRQLHAGQALLVVTGEAWNWVLAGRAALLQP